jgi:prepilin-type N-terminal cleavage/methylation domain-containing protein
MASLAAWTASNSSRKEASKMTNWDETLKARFRPTGASTREVLERHRRAEARRKALAGVTLVEVLIVVAIMAMLGGSVGFYALQQYKKAERSTAEQDARNLRKAIELWQVQNSESTCPTIGQLVADKQINSDSSQVDPWGQEWQFTCTDDDIFVQSNGPDRKPGTADDIRIPKLRAASET